MAARTDTGHRWADRGRYRAEPFAEPTRRSARRRKGTAEPVLTATASREAASVPRTTPVADKPVPAPSGSSQVSDAATEALPAVPPPVPATAAPAPVAPVSEQPKAAAKKADKKPEVKPVEKKTAKESSEKKSAAAAAPAAGSKSEATKKSAPKKDAPKATTEVVERTQRHPETGLLQIVEDLHVKYKVFSSGKAAGAGGAGGLLKRGVRGLKEVHALKGVSFVAYENESIGIIGSNGSGKSTLLRAITGLTPASSGSVYASSRPNLLGVGAALIPALSGNANITLGCLALGFSHDEIEELRPKIIEFAELQDFIDFPMKTYSSGMSARLKFAIASSKQHEILIVDEALAVGDARFRKRSEARIREIRENAGTIFLVSHSMKSIRDTCNRAIWIEKGVQKMDGTADEVVKAYEASRK